MGFRLSPFFGIRSKLVLISGILVVIPWLGYRYILEMEAYLRDGQEQVVLGTAQALATALSERPELFSESNFSRGQNRGRDLYVYPVYNILEIGHFETGDLLDWGDYQQYEREFREPGDEVSSQRKDDELAFKLMLGEHNNYLYLYLKVEDESLVLRSPDGRRVDRSDSIRISMATRDGVYQRYVVAPYGDEFISPWRIETGIGDIASLVRESQITGRWTRRPYGYEVEMRISLELMGASLGIGVIDVDDPDKRNIDAFVTTSDLETPDQLGILRRPTPELDRIVSGMGQTNSRIQIIDANQRLLRSVGDIQSAIGTLLEVDEEPESGFWGWIENHVLHPLYYSVLSKPTTDFVDELYQDGAYEGAHIESALKEGVPMTSFRTIRTAGEFSDTRILEAAYPIMSNDEVLGAVLVDQNMNGIRTLRNQAMEKLFDTMLAIFLVIVTVLFLFASNLSSRIRSLRNQAEKILDESGRLTNTITPSRSSDEIGDLSRSFSNIVDRLGQHTQYLENMASRLSHELRTPVTVVRSSLENLRMSDTENDSAVYLQRAEEGLKRLNLILTNMSEASRLEYIMHESDKELIDVTKVVKGCMAGYSQIYPQQKFRVDVDDGPLMVLGGAEYLAQALDKVIANAVDFSLPDRPVIAASYQDGNEIIISITNYGPYLSNDMEDQVFESMVSIRPQGKQKQPHLGMGLYIVRMIAEYHYGYALADNLEHEEGVVVSIHLPVAVA